MNKYTTMKVWTKTLVLIRILSALAGETMVAYLDRLVKQEYEHLKELEELLND